MRVAIVHYHLGRGGVTQVIRTVAHALAEVGVRCAVLTGDDGPRSEIPGVPTLRIRGLGYLADPAEITAGALAAELQATATEALGGPPDIWHFHNPTLGKNALLPAVVARFAAAGERMILQLHDLAEDGRPANFRLITDQPSLYPFSPRVRYAFLNRRDFETFIAAGLPAENAVVLANPISLAHSVAAPPSPTAAPILFAPVRGIRRKNLGELVLLAALAPRGAAIAVSRAPLDPTALAIHELWQSFAVRQRLPIAFDVVDRLAPAAGAPADFASWIDRASHIVTTSVAEGFGLPFLEAAAWGRPLLGRDLPHVTAGPAAHGIRCGRFYERILIPIDWVDRTVLRSELTVAMERHYRLYQRHLPATDIESAMAALITPHGVDFGNLPEGLQQGVIERLTHPAEREVPLAETRGGKLEPLESWLAATLADRAPTATASQLAPYGPAICRDAILEIYRELLAAPDAPVRHLPPAAILEAHLAPAKFHFLCSSPRPVTARNPFAAVVFDIYGTLLLAPSGRIVPDPAADPILREILTTAGYTVPESPTTALHEAVLRHHADSREEFPEIDLRTLWREVLDAGPAVDLAPLVELTEAAWHPARPAPGAAELVQSLARTGISLGLLSNAQCNAISSLGSLADLFPPELVVLSHRHGIAKPSAGLFQIIADRLAGRGISPGEVLFVGNDEAHDIAPARAAGFHTALFSPTATDSAADFVFHDWSALGRWIRQRPSAPAKSFA